MNKFIENKHNWNGALEFNDVKVSVNGNLVDFTDHLLKEAKIISSTSVNSPSFYIQTIENKIEDEAFQILSTMEHEQDIISHALKAAFPYK